MQGSDFVADYCPARGDPHHTTPEENIEMDGDVDLLLHDLMNTCSQRRFPADETTVLEPVRLMRDVAAPFPPRKYCFRV